MIPEGFRNTFDGIHPNPMGKQTFWRIPHLLFGVPLVPLPIFPIHDETEDNLFLNTTTIVQNV